MKLYAKRELSPHLGKNQPGWDIAHTVLKLFELADYKHIKHTNLDLDTLKVKIEGEFVHVSIYVKDPN